MRGKRITVVREEIVGFAGLILRKMDVNVSALRDEREDDDLDDDVSEGEEEGDLDTGIENEWLNKLLEKPPLHEFVKGRISIEIVKATGLPACDLNGKSDPYVVL
jgi:Ca2+-dependent lipid-binding protein